MWGRSLSLVLEITPTTLPADEATDVTLRFRFRNDSSKPQTVYPEAARFTAVSGWSSPQWDLRFDGPAKVRLWELRSWFGPPGQLPPQSYYDAMAATVPAGGELAHEMTACWMPGLPEQHLSVAALDPEGMDGLPAEETRDASVLVLNRSRSALEEERNRRVDFLRPGLIAFLRTPGDYTLTMGYRQARSTGFRPPKGLSLTSNGVPVTLVG